MRIARTLIGFVAAHAVAICLMATPASSAQPQAAQKTYASADEAAADLAAAARSNDQAALRTIFGSDTERLLSTGDPYAAGEQLRRFAADFDKKHALVPSGNDLMILDVGEDDWPLPIPIVQSDGRWHFDTKAGENELINRRIGRNELSAIRVSLAYVEAQKDYFARTKTKTGAGFYAERLISTPGREDGLYWPVEAGAEASPFADVVQQADEGGYAGAFAYPRPVPYNGYYFRVLKAEGVNSPGGAKSFVIKGGRMTEGFALIAWPSSYNSSGIMTFEVGPDGIVFQKDLGPNTAGEASTITQFDPDLTWIRVDVTNQ